MSPLSRRPERLTQHGLCAWPPQVGRLAWTAAGLHSDRAFELSAGLGFNGAMPYKSGRAALTQQKSLKLIQNSELKRAAESMQRALGKGEKERR